MRSAITATTRPLLRLLLRAKGLTGIPDARAQGALDESDSDALFAATRCEESAFPWDRAAGAEQRASQAVAAARAHPGHRLPAVQLQGRAAQRVDPAVRGVAEREPAAGAAGAAAGGAHADPLRRLRPAHAASRTPPSVAARIPGAQLVAVPFTGHSVVTSDLSGLRARTRSPPSSRASRAAQCPAAPAVIPPSPIAPTRLSRVPGRTTALKTVAAVTATVRDVALQFLGDEIAAGRATPVGAKVGGLRSGHATATVARLQPAPRRVRARRRRQRLRPGRSRAPRRSPISGRSAPARQADLSTPTARVTGRLGGRKVLGAGRPRGAAP